MSNHECECSIEIVCVCMNPRLNRSTTQIHGFSFPPDRWDVYISGWPRLTLPAFHEKWSAGSTPTLLFHFRAEVVTAPLHVDQPGDRAHPQQYIRWRHTPITLLCLQHCPMCGTTHMAHGDPATAANGKTGKHVSPYDAASMHRRSFECRFFIFAWGIERSSASVSIVKHMPENKLLWRSK